MMCYLGRKLLYKLFCSKKTAIYVTYLFYRYTCSTFPCMRGGGVRPSHEKKTWGLRTWELENASVQ